MVKGNPAIGRLVSSEAEHQSQQAGIVGESDKPLSTINHHACGLRNNNSVLCTKASKPVESKPVRSRDGECVG